MTYAVDERGLHDGALGDVVAVMAGLIGAATAGRASADPIGWEYQPLPGFVVSSSTRTANPVGTPRCPEATEGG